MAEVRERVTEGNFETLIATVASYTKPGPWVGGDAFRPEELGWVDLPSRETE